MRDEDMSKEHLSDAKQKILEMLWPMEWVDGADIFKAIQQTYYDRRIRELRESGWQIQTKGRQYRLISHEKLAGNIRKYPTANQKRQVLERDNGTCQMCGVVDANIQFDHKVPMERLGKTEVDNIQLLCRTCNVEKRGVCKRCTLETCDGCPYAYPEQFGTRFIIMLDTKLAQKVRTEARQKSLAESTLVSELLKKHYDL
jgi:hypothetical protein